MSGCPRRVLLLEDILQKQSSNDKSVKLKRQNAGSYPPKIATNAYLKMCHKAGRCFSDKVFAMQI